MFELRRLRNDLAAFSRALGRPLSDWQAHDLRLAAAITCLLWGRGMGKSRGLAVLGLWWAFRAPRRRVLVVSGSGEIGSRRLLREGREAAVGWGPLAASTLDEQEGLLRLSNGSEIRAVSGSEHSVRGWPVDLAICDEAQLASDDLILSALLPTVTAREGAKIVLAGTASVASGAYFDLCRQGEVGKAGLAFARRVSRLVGGDDAAPWQNATVIEAQRAAMGPARFAAEHLCQWSSGADAFISRQQLLRVVADFRVPTLGTLCGPARVSAGVDWGWRRNRSTCVAVARIAGHPLFAVCAVQRWPQAHPLPSVVADVATSPSHYGTLVLELNGLGGPQAERLAAAIRQRPGWSGGVAPHRLRIIEEGVGGGPGYGQAFGAGYRRRNGHRVRRPSFSTRIVGVHLDAKLKAGGYGSMRAMFESEQLVVPAAAVELIHELLALKVTLTEAGEKVAGASDDLCDGLMLALEPMRFGVGAYDTRVGLLAKRLRERPEEPDGGELVETASGLRLPARPSWQSVAGEEVTHPDAAAPTGEDLERQLPPGMWLPGTEPRGGDARSWPTSDLAPDTRRTNA